MGRKRVPKVRRGPERTRMALTFRAAPEWVEWFARACAAAGQTGTEFACAAIADRAKAVGTTEPMPARVKRAPGPGVLRKGTNWEY